MIINPALIHFLFKTEINCLNNCIIINIQYKFSEQLNVNLIDLYVWRLNADELPVNLPT